MKNNYNNNPFTMMYEYGVRGGSTLSHDKEYIFACRGRPFAALVSDHFPTPSSTLLDYDLIKKLGLKVTDIQCRKFMFAGHKFRILGRVSTAVQCVQNGRISGNFHIKGLVISDLNQMLDTHCVAGTKMRERIEGLTGEAVNESDLEEDSSDDELDTSLEDNYQPTLQPEMMPSSSPATVRPSSSQATAGLTSSSHTVTTVSSSLTMTATTCAPSAPVQMSLTSSAPVQKLPSNPALVVGPNTVKSKVPFTPLDTVIPPGIIGPGPANLYAIGDSGGYDFWRNYAEGKLLDRSRIDGVPRVVNLTGNYLSNRHDGDMLRVGDWARLEDPAEHQARQVILANIRRANPDRACVLCSYNLASNHSCSLPMTVPGTVNHCKDCCRELTQP